MMDMRYKKNPMIIERQHADATVLIDPYRRTMILLDPVAREIWGALDGTRSVADIMALLKDGFEVDEPTLHKDVTVFLNDLVKREIIR